MIVGSTARASGKGVSFLGIALMLAGVACGDSSNNPNGISTGDGGRSGGGPTAGRGGTGGSAGSGGASAAGAAGEASDAGLAGAGGSAGTAGGTGAGGSGERPPGCPEPSPILAQGQTIVIQSINFETSEIVLRNASTTPQSINLGRQGWQWCAFPRYWSLTDEITTIDLGPDETYSFIAINNQSGVADLAPEEGEMAIYNRVQAFDDYQAMEAFVAWGEIQAYRESYAVQRGVWTYEERIEIGSGDAGFIVTGDTNRASGYTSVPARCLVP